MTILNKIQPKSLQQRITLFVLIPVCLLMIIMGLAGFLFARDIILYQWGETAIAKLQKAAHKIDMRLSRPKELLLLIHNESGSDKSHLVHEFIVDQLKTMEGIAEVNVEWPKLAFADGVRKKMAQGRTMRMKYSRMSRIQTSLPKFNPRFKSETVSISSDFVDKDGQRVGSIEVVIEFHDLVDQILNAPWWQSNKAFIIDNTGNILSSTLLKENEHIHQDREKFGLTDPLEIMTLEAIQKEEQGTIFGPGHPPDEISGFYHLTEAPWNIVIIAPGKSVLQPLIKFRTYYFLVGIIFILGIIIFIRIILIRTKDAIKNVSNAAKEIAKGHFGAALPVESRDEVGVLTQTFNVMSQQLEERLRLKKEMNLAMEMQQNLLPVPNYSGQNFEISGIAIYCDETGGDYFDIIELNESKDRVCIAVGDVVGHGVGAALLMTTTRALLRSSLYQNQSLSDAVTQANRLLCQDTSATGNFVTLFVMIIDAQKKELRWVRAGHDPALLYDSDKKEVVELKGNGVVLGLDDNFSYAENVHTGLQKGMSCIIGTDGVWEVENDNKERFGKKRVKEILRKYSDGSSQDMLETLTSDIRNFMGDAHQNDDITIVCLKFK